MISSILPIPKTYIVSQNTNQRSKKDTISTNANQLQMQYYSDTEKTNNALLKEVINELNIMEVASINISTVSVHMVLHNVNLNYIVKLAHLMFYLSIIDGGTDTYTLVASWIQLFTITKKTPLADVVRFDSKAEKKHHLPIGPHTTKTIDTDGR